MGEPWRKRFALVIGVNKYKEKPLKNAATDARQMEQLLKEKGGFEVDCVVNPTREELLRKVRSFKKRINSHKGDDPDVHGCIALFYYAGHGLIDARGRHYLLPVNWELDEPTADGLEAALNIYGCKLKDVLADLKDAYAAIVLIDACQEQPVTQPALRDASSSMISGNRSPPEILRGGWGGDAIGSMHHRQNLLVGHACSPRRTASDGLSGQGTFTAHVIEELCNPVHRHVMDAILAVNVAVFNETKDCKVPQQPRLDVSARPGLFDAFKLERPRESLRLTEDQSKLRKHLQEVCHPCRQKESQSKRLVAAQELLQLLTEAGDMKEAHMRLLADLDAVPLLVGVLRDDSSLSDVRIAICQILEELAHKPEHRDLIAAKGAAPVLLKSFITNDLPKARDAAWGVLQELKQCKVAKVSMLHHRAVERLIQCSAECYNNQDKSSYLANALDLLTALMSGHCYVSTAKGKAKEQREVLLACIERARGEERDFSQLLELLNSEDKH